MFFEYRRGPSARSYHEAGTRPENEQPEVDSRRRKWTPTKGEIHGKSSPARRKQ